MTTCWECPIGGGTCPPISRCPLPRHQHTWADTTQADQRWRHETCTDCGGERTQPRDDDSWLIA